MISFPDGTGPTKELIAFAERQVRNAHRYTDFERRSEHRHFMVVPVLAVPVDEQHNPIGDPIAMVTRDVSPTGIGLIHCHSIPHGLTAFHMQIAGEEVNLIADILWSKPLGPFEYSGGQYVAKLKSFPQRSPSSTDASAGAFSVSPLGAGRACSPC